MEFKGRKWLEDNGFDGLFVSGVCACENKDLAPCGEGPTMSCQPGYRHDDPRPGYEGYWGIFAQKGKPGLEEWGDIGYC